MRMPPIALAALLLSWRVLAGGAAGDQGGALRSAPEWPGWGGPRGDFTADAKALATTWPAGGPKRLWTRPLGEGHSSVVVDHGRLYTAFRPPTGVAGQFREDEVVAALDSATGKTLWEHPYRASLDTMDFSRGAGPHVTPRVAGDRLFAAGTDKQFFALDKHTGKLLWSHNFVKEYGALPNQMRWAPVMAGYAPSPLVYKDIVIAMVGGPKHGVMAFRQDDGRVVWSSSGFPDDITASSPLLVTLEGQDQLVVTSGDAVHGIDPNDGAILWTFPFPTKYGANMSTPVWSPHDRLLFLSAAYDGLTRVVELRPRIGGRTEAKELWSTNRMRVHFSNVVRIGDHYYGSSGDFGPSFLTAIHARTGVLSLQDRTFAKASFIQADGKVILLDEDGTLALVTMSPDKLTVLAQAEVASGVSWTVPTLVGRTLYVRDRLNIMALDLGATQ
jgi:outer membrane protein assembly factor BamB